MVSFSIVKAEFRTQEEEREKQSLEFYFSMISLHFLSWFFYISYVDTERSNLTEKLSAFVVKLHLNGLVHNHNLELMCEKEWATWNKTQNKREREIAHGRKTGTQ